MFFKIKEPTYSLTFITSYSLYIILNKHIVYYYNKYKLVISVTFRNYLCKT